jgi:hypothetical protein
MSDRSFKTHEDRLAFEFTGMRGKSYEHQLAAIAAGYESTAEMAIDELARRLIALENRVDAIDGGEQEVVADGA